MDSGLTEYELDHVLFGKHNSSPTPNPNEVEDWRYINLSDLQEEVKTDPTNFTAWFKIILDRVIEKQSVHSE